MVLNELENRNRTSKFWQILHLSRIIENVFISLKILSSLYSIFIILISNDNYIQNTELLNETTLIYLQQTNTIEILFNLIRIFNFLNAKYIKYDLKSSYFCKQKTYMFFKLYTKVYNKKNPGSVKQLYKSAYGTFRNFFQ